MTRNEWACDDMGSGLPLVLIHGFPMDRTLWRHQRDALRTLTRVMTVDLPGFGETPLPETPWTIASVADDLRAFLAQRDALPAIVGGLSMGGYIALAFADRHPADLRGLLLVDTKSQSDDAAGKVARDEMITRVRTQGTSAMVDIMFPKLVGSSTITHHPEPAEQIRQMMLRVAPESAVAALGAMRDREDYTASLGRISVPTMVIVGSEDAVTPVALAECMSGQISGSDLRVISNAGHVSPMEQPLAVSAAIKEFRARVTF